MISRIGLILSVYFLGAEVSYGQLSGSFHTGPYETGSQGYGRTTSRTLELSENGTGVWIYNAVFRRNPNDRGSKDGSERWEYGIYYKVNGDTLIMTCKTGKKFSNSEGKHRQGGCFSGERKIAIKEEGLLLIDMDRAPIYKGNTSSLLPQKKSNKQEEKKENNPNYTPPKEKQLLFETNQKKDDKKEENILKHSKSQTDLENDTNPLVKTSAEYIELSPSEVEGQSNVKYFGGSSGLQKEIQNHLTYPSSEYNSKIQGIVVVGFEISKEGTVENISILRSVSEGLDQEAIRVVKLLKNWKPAEKDGETINAKMNIPFRFAL